MGRTRVIYQCTGGPVRADHQLEYSQGVRPRSACNSARARRRGDRMRRRAFITLLGGAAAWPLAARAQQGDRVRLLVAMMGGRNADIDPEGRAWFVAFRQALQELGWVEGRNFRADYRWPAGDLDRMRAIAKEFVDLKPDVMFAGNTPSVEAL